MIRRLAEQLNVHPEALRNWIRQAQPDHGERDDRPSTTMLGPGCDSRNYWARFSRVIWHGEHDEVRRALT
ncbi:transposase [Rhodococcus qingshengii]|uniref:transposase n=1 Tax=Rhodococcus qingshengii TaxID=334542 RepID=UPI001C2223C5|nr:transposase [Rhodococcus qingshengii]